jgi:hypothetical protein
MPRTKLAQHSLVLGTERGISGSATTTAVDTSAGQRG